MNAFARALLAATAALTTSLPAVAHMTSSEAPHLHAGDGWGLVVVAVLTVLAAWLGRRGR